MNTKCTIVKLTCHFHIILAMFISLRASYTFNEIGLNFNSVLMLRRHRPWVVLCSTKKECELLTLRTSERDLICKEDLYRGSWVKMRLAGRALIQDGWYPDKQGKFGDRQTRDNEGRKSVTLVQAKGTRTPGDIGWNRFCLTTSGATNPADIQITDFQPPERRQYISVGEAPRFAVLHYSRPSKLT